MEDTNSKKVYLVGAGIASLASAAYFIKEGEIPGENIFIFEESKNIGGSMDGEKLPKNAYVLRGYRMFESRVYTSTLDLMSFIPSLTHPRKTLKDEFSDFNRENKFFDKCRLVENGRRIDSGRFGLSWKDRWNLIKIIGRTEASLGASQIQDNFSREFFKTNYWYEMCTVFAFQPRHSAAEFRRYCLRYIHEAPNMSTVRGMKSTPLNQLDSLITPLASWLVDRGVHFEKGCTVYDMDFGESANVEKIYYRKGKSRQEIAVDKNDYVLATIGSMTENSSNGTMDAAPAHKATRTGGAWELWENISQKVKNFGRPSVFCSDTDKTKLESFTITFRDSVVPDLIKKFTGREAGLGEAVTFKDSNWLVSIIVPHQPYFIDQPKELTIAWGYALSPDQKGDYVKKAMHECSGEEILTELFSHFRFDEEVDMERLIEKSVCIPSWLPYGTSQFLPRRAGDRPAVIPEGSRNFAFIGQFCEVPEEATFTVEYSVRSALIAVSSLLGLRHKMPPIYQGKKRAKVLYNALKTILR